MSEQNSESVTEVKHFIRPDARAREKQLVTERVQQGSMTFEFLQRMERRRLQQECQLNVDMRGKVPYECRRYNYRNRVFWMDDLTYEMFKEGLREHDGVFTVETFEQIMAAEHTFRAMERSAAAQEAEATAATALTTGQGAAPGAAFGDRSYGSGAADVAATRPDVIRLGYYRDRCEVRLQHCMGVLLHLDGQALPVQTIDMSPNGLRLAAKHALRLQPDQEVAVTFTQLNQDHEAHLNEVGYRVLGFETVEREFRIRMARLNDGDPEAPRVLRRFIDEQLRGAQRKRKQDYEDERLTAYSLLAEQFYTTSSAVIPFFLVQEDQSVRLDVICCNDNALPSLEVFRDAHDQYDFCGLAAPERIAQLHRHTREDGQRDPLIAVYKEKDDPRPRVVADFELETQEQWFALLSAKCNRDEFRVYKALLRPVHRPDCRKIYDKIMRLSEKSIDQAEQVVCQADRHVASGVLVDLTQQFRDWGFGQRFFGAEVAQAALPLAERLAEARGAAPELLRFGYVEQRHEDRYRVSLAVEVTLDNRQHQGETCDISLRGLCIQVKQLPPGVGRGDLVHVSFPGLQKRAGGKVRLRDIPCEITRVDVRDGVVRLALKRVMDARSAEVTAFFKDLIARNQGKLQPDLVDVITAANSRLYASMAAESAATVPFFVLKNIDSGEREVKVALPREPGSFAAFFEVAPGEYDFTPLAEPQRLARMLSDLRSNKTADMVLYLYKRWDAESSRFEIQAACDGDFGSAYDKFMFVREALEHDHCFVKLGLAPVCRPKETEVHAVIEPLMAKSAHRANRLQTDFEQIAAVGDVTDITRQVMEAGNLPTSPDDEG